MRVITGKARGIQLKTPEGQLTRPTSDRVKEALFSIIQFEIPGAAVLDLFGGTGQLGIECLSRGAASAVFVDRRADAVKLIRENLKVTELTDRARVVSGDSMYSTLMDGDYLLLLSNIFYQEPQQGDIIVASKDSYDDGAPIIKRVIATEGQIVDIDFVNGIVYVDGLPLEEPYINNLTTRQEGVLFPLIVEEGCIFVLGDNRAVSKDSRHPDIGLIDTRQVLGKALYLMVPGVDEWTKVRDFDRTGVIQ